MCCKRKGFEAIPGCSEGGDDDIDGKDYCFDRAAYPTSLLYKGRGPPYDTDDSNVLGPCEGDCDNDEECSGDLKCYQRDDYKPVPGCDGGGGFKVDYCFDSNPSATPEPTPGPTPVVSN